MSSTDTERKCQLRGENQRFVRRNRPRDVETTFASLSSITVYCCLRQRCRIVFGEDVDVKDGEGGTRAFHFASMFGSTGAVRALLIAGADVDCRGGRHNGVTPLHGAATLGRDAALLTLLTRGANPKATTERGSTALHLALGWRGGDPQATAVDLLLRWGA